MDSFRRACPVKLLAQLDRYRELDRGKIVLELRQFGRADDTRGYTGLSGYPVQGHLRRPLLELFRDAEKYVEDSPVALCEFFENRVSRSLRLLQPALSASAIPVALILAAQKTTRQGAPGADGKSKLLRGRNVFALDVALDQRILELQSH